METRLILLIVFTILFLVVALLAFFTIRKSRQDEEKLDARWHIYHPEDD